MAIPVLLLAKVKTIRDTRGLAPRSRQRPQRKAGSGRVKGRNRRPGLHGSCTRFPEGLHPPCTGGRYARLHGNTTATPPAPQASARLHRHRRFCHLGHRRPGRAAERLRRLARRPGCGIAMGRAGRAARAQPALCPERHHLYRAEKAALRPAAGPDRREDELPQARSPLFLRIHVRVRGCLSGEEQRAERHRRRLHLPHRAEQVAGAALGAQVPGRRQGRGVGPGQGRESTGEDRPHREGRERRVPHPVPGPRPGVVRLQARPLPAGAQRAAARGSRRRRELRLPGGRSLGQQRDANGRRRGARLGISIAGVGRQPRSHPAVGEDVRFHRRDHGAPRHERPLLFYESWLLAAAFGFTFVLLAYLAAFLNFYLAYAIALVGLGLAVVLYLQRLMPRERRETLWCIWVATMLIPTAAVILEGYTGIIYTLEILAALLGVMALSIRADVRAFLQNRFLASLEAK